MDKENELDDFLGSVDNDFSQDEKNPLDVEGTEEYSEETTQEVEKEEKLPFNKDPKVQRFIEKELSKRLAGIEDRISKVSNSNQGVKEDEDDYWVRLIGNDTPEKLAFIKEAKAREEEKEQRAAERAYQKLISEKEREEAQVKEVEEKLTNSIEDIEEEFNIDLTSKDPVAKKTRVDFLKYVEKIAPKDENGEFLYLPDMRSTFETFQELKKKTSSNERAKDLASRGTSRSGDVTNTPTQRITFDNIDELIRNQS